MKKLITALLIAAIVPAFAACGPSEDTDTDNNTTSSVSSVDSDEADTTDTADSNNEESDEEATKQDEEATEPATEEKADDNAESTSADDEINPELVKVLNDFESYADDYVAFMKKYGNIDIQNMTPEEVFAIDFTGYTEESEALMAKSDSILKDIQNIDFATLTPAEKEYFTEVRERADKKIEDAGIE